MYFNLRTAFTNVSLRYNHGGYEQLPFCSTTEKMLSNFLQISGQQNW